MKISEIITDKYKLRIPPTVYYELLADVQEAEEKQEPTTKNNSKFCPDRKAKTTNMETILHCIENECAAYKDGKCLKYNSNQEPTTKNDSSELEKNSKKLEKDFGELDCISRESVLKLIYDYKENHSNDREHYPINYGTLLDMCRWVRKLPLVTPQEPRKGHWIDTDEWRETVDGFEQWGYFRKCSKCGYVFKFLEIDNYCPNCGADMREVKE